MERLIKKICVKDARKETSVSSITKRADALTRKRIKKSQDNFIAKARKDKEQARGIEEYELADDAE